MCQQGEQPTPFAEHGLPIVSSFRIDC